MIKTVDKKNVTTQETNGGSLFLQTLLFAAYVRSVTRVLLAEAIDNAIQAEANTIFPWRLIDSLLINWIKETSRLWTLRIESLRIRLVRSNS